MHPNWDFTIVILLQKAKPTLHCFSFTKWILRAIFIQKLLFFYTMTPKSNLHFSPCSTKSKHFTEGNLTPPNNIYTFEVKKNTKEEVLDPIDQQPQGDFYIFYNYVLLHGTLNTSNSFAVYFRCVSYFSKDDPTVSCTVEVAPMVYLFDSTG